MQSVTGELTPETMHREVKGRVVPLNSLQEFSDLDNCVQFLADFSHKSLLRAFPGFNLTVSESGFLLTERLWETGAVSIWGYLLSEGMWILAAGGLEMIKISYICIYADIFDFYTCDGRQCDRSSGFEFQDRKIL